tara:strand:+ start:1451 stop:1633 length:183 start_codon:yes stop_codon:yes gene_type:complete
MFNYEEYYMIENQEEVCALLKETYVVPKAADNKNARNSNAVSQNDMVLISAVPVLEPYDY